MTERTLTTTILKALRAHGAWCFKVHGGPTQEVGLPDIVGIERGVGFGLEVKLPGLDATPIQRVQLERIRAAGGLSKVVHSVDEALAALGIRVQSPEEATVSTLASAR